MVTVDILLLRNYRGKEQVLLIRRGQKPYSGKWALPGGYVDENESLESAALRELREETNIQQVSLRQLGAYGDPGRDPRGHTVTIVYGGVLPENSRMKPAAGDDAAQLKWFSVDHLPTLAFDHQKIIEQWVKNFRENGAIGR
jgi:8-oxo-dGTP diphosphatase